MLGNARNNRAFLQTVVDTELQEFVGLGHLRAFQYRTYADVQFGEIFVCDGFADRFRLVVGLFVGFLRIQELLHLLLDDAIVNLFKEQFGFP